MKSVVGTKHFLLVPSFSLIHDNSEAWSGCEAIGETKNSIEVHMDGKKHWYCT